jgi:hypothetical protein
MRRSFRFPLMSPLLGLLAFGLGYLGHSYDWPLLALSGFVLMVVAVTSGGAWLVWRWIILIRNVIGGHRD